MSHQVFQIFTITNIFLYKNDFIKTDHVMGNFGKCYTDYIDLEGDYGLTGIIHTYFALHEKWKFEDNQNYYQLPV